ncbi:hypothetical protein [Thalassotalea euphylliae]|uniref:Uncharacterized protein n=1 Tax=Thalassotalea euphylliae TaxID=1655234 RepID=A0A3E0U3A8_9GAMM|nr:hypothetical protein [Thalassotalea euphylliae]REL31418.1 hypothetical protein DXX94_12215 [Thalassotalea euphylliae]
MNDIDQKELVFNLLIELYSVGEGNIEVSSFDTFSLTKEFSLNSRVISILQELNKQRELLGKLELNVDYEDVSFETLEPEDVCTHLSISINKPQDKKPIFFATSAIELIDKQAPFLAKGAALPDYYYLVNEGYKSTSKDKPVWFNNLSVVQDWFALFRSLSDIDKPTENGELIYFIAKRDKDKFLKHTELELIIDYSYTRIQNIPKLGEFTTFLQSKSDLHTEERKVFFKQAIVQVLSDVAEDKTSKVPVVKSLLENIDKLTASYHEQVQVFIQNFALDEFHNEVENKYFEYIESINKTVGDVQAKMFAVPASLIGIGALLKASSWLSYSFIVLGIFIVCLFSQFIISEQFSRFKQIQDSINFVFRKLTEDGIQKLDRTKVIKEIREMKERLGAAIESKKERLVWYGVFVWINLLLAPLLLWLKLYVAIT